MLTSLFFGTAVRFIVVALPIASAQLGLSGALPDCISQCIDQSTDDSCQITDVKCICRESDGAFLPNMVSCIHDTCDSDINVSDLLTPLSLACEIAGTPISESAIENAESSASAIASVTTKFVTMTDAASVSILMMTTTFTTTVNGEVQTSTETDPASSASSAAAQSSESDSSPSSSSSSAPSSSSQTSSQSTTSLTTTTVAGQETTAGPSASGPTSKSETRTQTAGSSEQTNSAPLGFTNVAPRERGSNWMILGFMVAAAMIFG